MNFHTRIWEVHHDWCYDNPVILYGLIRSMKPKVVVEVGTYRGFSASWMAQALKENGAGHLYCIDNFSLTDHTAKYGDARKHLHENLVALEVRDWITILDGDSEKVQWPDKVDFAYVDGWHGFRMASHDFNQCAARGAECICLDDTIQSVGPRLLMAHVRQEGMWNVLDIHRDCGMSICMRRTEPGPITFSQELPNNPGVDLQTLTPLQHVGHFLAATKANNVDYMPILNLVHPGKPS